MTEERKNSFHTVRGVGYVLKGGRMKKSFFKDKINSFIYDIYSCGCRNGSWNIVFFEWT